MKKCKNCGEEFTPRFKTTEKYCWDEACKEVEIKLFFEKEREKARKAKEKAWRKEKKERNEALKTVGDYIKEVQTVFNKWIRLRDRHEPCISCQRHHEGQYHAGHYRSVGGNPELRFHELNNNKQCAPCNNHLSGNLINYRINLIKKIGIKWVEVLEGPHSPKNYSIPELLELKDYYKKQVKIEENLYKNNVDNNLNQLF